MIELPDEVARAELVDELAGLVERHGAEPLLLPPLLPTSKWFPDPWAPDVAGATAVTRRLLAYAGLPELHAAVGSWADQPTYLRERGHHASGGGVAAWFLGLEGSVAHFAVEEAQLGDPEAVVATLAHEVAHAWRAARDEHVEDHRREEELTDLTTVYLGFGVLTANAAYRYRKTGWASGSMAYTRTSQLKLGYLGPGTFSFLLAIQAAARGARWGERRRLLAQLEPNQAGAFTAGLRTLRGGVPVLQRRLGGPSRTQRPPPEPLRAKSVSAVRTRADDLTSAANVQWNAGRPVFRVLARSDLLARLLAPCIYAIGGAVPAMLLGNLLGDRQGTQVGLATGGLAGLLAGFWFGVFRRAQPSDTCSDMSCQADLPRGMSRCPVCGGTIMGEIRNPDERLEAEERLGQDDDDLMRQARAPAPHGERER